MAEKFCARTARKIQRLGYPPELAVRLARFCYVSMLSVSGAMLLVLNGGRAVPVLPVSSSDMPAPARAAPARFLTACVQQASAAISCSAPAGRIVPALQRRLPAR